MAFFAPNKSFENFKSFTNLSSKKFTKQNLLYNIKFLFVLFLALKMNSYTFTTDENSVRITGMM